MKHKQDVFVHYEKRWNGEDDYSVYKCDISAQSKGVVLVCKTSIEFETPDDFNPVAAQVQALEAERKAITEEFAMRCKQINDQISNLQALTFEAAE